MRRAVEKERRLLGQRLFALRAARELSQEQAAELMGIHPKHLQRIEIGSANVTVAALVAAALAYRVPLRALFELPDGESQAGAPSNRRRRRPPTTAAESKKST